MKKLTITALLLIFGITLLTAHVHADETTVDSLYFGLSNGPLRLAIAANLPDGVVLSYGDKTIKESELATMIAGSRSASLKAQLNKNKFFVLERIAFNKVLISLAKNWSVETKFQGKTDDNSIVDAYISNLEGNIAVSDEDAQNYYNENEADFGGVPFEQAAEDIKAVLRGERLESEVNNTVGAVLSNATTKVNAKWLKKEATISLNTEADKARRSKKVALVEFGSEGCPACVRMTPVIKELRTTYAKSALIVPVSLDDDMIIGDRYDITLIPTLIFFSEDGKEAYRHVGIMSHADIVTKLTELGAKLN